MKRLIEILKDIRTYIKLIAIIGTIILIIATIKFINAIFGSITGTIVIACLVSLSILNNRINKK